MENNIEPLTINDFLKQRSALFVAIGTILMVVFFTLIVINRQKINRQNSDDKIKISTLDKEVTLNRNGLVEFTSDEGSYQNLFDSSEIDSLFSYVSKLDQNSQFQDGYQLIIITGDKTKNISVPNNDPVIGQIINQVTGSSPNSPTTNYFQPSPTSFSSGSTGGGGSGGSGGGGGSSGGSGGSGGGGSEDCLFWTLSWCFVFPSPTPTGTQNLNPTPTGFIQQAADCDLYSQQVTKRTIISNTLCIIDITPTP